jgi:hypothetical protein
MTPFLIILEKGQGTQSLVGCGATPREIAPSKATVGCALPQSGTYAMAYRCQPVFALRANASLTPLCDGYNSFEKAPLQNLSVL